MAHSNCFETSLLKEGVGCSPCVVVSMNNFDFLANLPMFLLLILFTVVYEALKSQAWALKYLQHHHGALLNLCAISDMYVVLAVSL